ncbi:MAG TPA: ATP-dependent helicase, partial [Spirochaetia bacterium]|nr:ATP-dependent helicase [Spirochaetia bacterium]
TLYSEGGLLWLGCGSRRLTFCFPQDVELFHQPPHPGEALALLPGASGRFSFWDIVDHARGTPGGPRDSAETAARLWELAWKGLVTCDSFAPVRRGLATGFRSEDTVPEPGRRTRFNRWQSERPGGGFWYAVPFDPGDRDALEEEELARERVRQVLRRHGVVFRELLEHELPALRWPRLFRSLRLMEFSGEVVGGRFFDGVSGLQFALPSVVEELAAGDAAGPPLGTSEPDDTVWWINAADPASLCGVDIPALKAVLPARISSTHVVFHGGAVVLVSRRRGRQIDLRVPPDAPRLGDYLGFVRVLTGRDARPLASVHVETINGEPAPSSPYKERFLQAGFVEDFRRLTFAARP